jgi:hypothetical protein
MRQDAMEGWNEGSRERGRDEWMDGWRKRRGKGGMD